MNVLTNAEQACVSAHGKGKITVSIAAENDVVKICVRDDGLGIPQDQLGKIFEPVYTTKDVGHGTGLGLSVSMGIVSQHEGNIWAENIVGGGAAFNVELPSNTGAGVPVVERGLDSATPEIAGNSASHILVVDDEPDSRTILAKQFELRRHDVDQAGDGEEAWRKLQRLDYDCILLDLRMPGMGGQELYERIKVSIPDLVDRIVFITGDTVNPATRSFLTGIGNAVLSKPFDFRELE